MAQCFERPIDVCCHCFLKEHPQLETKECIFPYCEPLRRFCDFRLVWKRPFATCVLFGICFGFIPATIIVLAVFSSFFSSGQLNEASNSTNCLLATFWGAIEFCFCITNFCYTWWLFKELERPEEERDFCYERDIVELYKRYEVYQYPHILDQMRTLHSSYERAKKDIAEERAAFTREAEVLRTQLGEISSMSSIQLRDNKEYANEVFQQKAILTKRLNAVEKSLIRNDATSDASLMSRVLSLVGTDPNCATFLLLMICGFVWTIAGSMFLKGNNCANPLLMMACRMMLYSVYIFIIMGIGVCFCNLFAISEISHHARHNRADLSEIEILLNTSPPE